MKVARSATFLLTMLAAAACSSKDSPPAGEAGPDVATTSASTPAPSAGEPSANDISNYKLDMEKMRRYVVAIKGFQSLSAADSAAAEAMAGSSANESTAQMIAKLEANPIAMRELRKAGLSARDYVWITAAWLQAAMTQGIMEANAQAKLPEGQNPQNIEFLTANKAELERIMKDAGMTQ